MSLCQQISITSRRLKVHMPQHFITPFCPCGEYSYDRDYILMHQRTMKCHVANLFDVDEPTFPEFFTIIRPLVKDSSRLTHLSKGYSHPKAHYSRTLAASPLCQGKMNKNTTVPLPLSSPQVVLRGLDTNSAQTETPDSEKDFPSPSSRASQSKKKGRTFLSPATTLYPATSLYFYS